MTAETHTHPASLAAEGVHVWRGERHVLRGLNFTLGEGRLLHVHGPNGAGKTTLLRVLCGLMRPEEGEVRWREHPIRTHLDAYHRDLASGSHEPALKADLTALENLRYAVLLRRSLTEAQLRGALDRCGVLHCADLPARVLSAGQRRRVAMARIFALGARLWLLDEPFTNLDVAGSAMLAGLINEHIAAGGMAVVVTHQELELNFAFDRLSLAA